MIWLTYGRAGRLIGVVIMEAPTLIQARMDAAVEGIIDAGAHVVEGHKLSAKLMAPPESGLFISQACGGLRANVSARPLLHRTSSAQSVTAGPMLIGCQPDLASLMNASP
jgi:hypothetical protein